MLADVHNDINEHPRPDHDMAREFLSELRDEQETRGKKSSTDSRAAGGLSVPNVVELRGVGGPAPIDLASVPGHCLRMQQARERTQIFHGYGLVFASQVVFALALVLEQVVHRVCPTPIALAVGLEGLAGGVLALAWAGVVFESRSREAGRSRRNKFFFWSSFFSPNIKQNLSH